METPNQDLGNIPEITKTDIADGEKSNGFVNEKGEFVRGKNINSEKLKGFVNEKGEFVRGKDVENEQEKKKYLPDHLL